ncbi:MAG: lysostaphin resistance A-like protein [Flavobacteriia bacterium]|jgi:membrane protease YdiL (CAAX protease family)|nr:CPBP family intramembrane metalloprotease [Cryomorphaceae bacterium]
MSFLTSADQGNSRVSGYILTLCIVVLCYAVLGSIPLIVHLSIANGGGEGALAGSMSDWTALLGENTILCYLLFPFVLVLLTLVLSNRFIHKRSIVSLFTSRARFDWKRFFTAAGIWAAVMAVLLAVMMVDNNKIEWNMNPSTIIPLVLISFLLIPIQTTAEEVLFRGYLFQAFGHKNRRGWISVVLTGILFGLMHAANPEVETLGYGVMSYYIMTGIFLGFIVLMDDGLELSMGYHAANNIFAALILTNEWQAFQTDALWIDHAKPTFGWDVIATMLILQPLICFAFYKLYKWKNLRSKLLDSQ